MRHFHRPFFLALLLATAPFAALAPLAHAQRPQTVELFNGNDLDGWEVITVPSATPDTTPSWRYNPSGHLTLTGKPVSYLATKASHSNYRLHVEWRWPADAAKNSNSGILLHITSLPGPRGSGDFELSGGLAYGGNNTAGPIDVATAVNAHGGPCGRIDFESETFLAFDWQSGGDSRGLDPKPTAQLQRCQVPALSGGSAVRRLTPLECERLQGFPDDYTLIPYRGKPAADGPRYKALGNSMAVPCMRWIFDRIGQVDAIPAERRGA